MENKIYFQSFMKYNNQINAVGDYTDDDEEFLYQNDTDEIINITKMVIFISDKSSLKYTTYGANTILENGIKMYFTKDGMDKYIISDDLPIMTNCDWLQYCCDVFEKKHNNNYNTMTITFTFEDCPITIEQGEKIAIVLNDDFTNITKQTFHISGCTVKNT